MLSAVFAWYRDAHICFVYLADVDTRSNAYEIAFGISRWFSRGWTLQELIAYEKYHMTSRTCCS